MHHIEDKNKECKINLTRDLLYGYLLMTAIGLLILEMFPNGDEIFHYVGCGSCSVILSISITVALCEDFGAIGMLFLVIGVVALLMFFPMVIIAFKSNRYTAFIIHASIDWLIGFVYLLLSFVELRETSYLWSAVFPGFLCRTLYFGLIVYSFIKITHNGKTKN